MTDSRIVSDILLKQQDASYMLETLICDLLDLAKIENNKFDLNLKYYDLTKSIYNTLKLMMFQANQKNIEFQVLVDKKSDLPML
jgi:signal transduction histidine kinase